MSETNVNVESVLRVGKPIKLCLRVNDEVKVHRSRVLKVLPDDIVVVWPTEQETRVPITVGQNVILQANGDRGVFQLSSSIAATRSEPVQALHITRAGDWTRSQLRLNVRIEVAIVDPEALVIANDRDYADLDSAAVKWAIVNALQKGGIHGQPISAVIRDISAGGMRIATASPLNPGAVVWIEFPLDKGQWEVAAMARVVWVAEEDSPRRKYPYKAGCQFLDLGTREQDNIAKFVFARQSELRRWGLL